MNYAKNLIIASAALMINAGLFAEKAWYCDCSGKEMKCYAIVDGKRRLSPVKKNQFLSELKQKIDRKAEYTVDLSSKTDYYNAIYTIKHFNENKSAARADYLIKNNRLKQKDRDFFIRSCRKWPFIKFYSQYCSKKYYPIDPKFSFLVLFTESAGFLGKDGSCGEKGDSQIMKYVWMRYKNSWSKDPFWIEGKDYTDPVNNLICGIRHLASSKERRNCRKDLEEMTSSEFLGSYSYYVSKGPFFHSSKRWKWPSYLADNVPYLRLLEEVENASADGGLISSKGKKLLEKNYAKK